MGVVPGQVWEQQGVSCVLPSGMGGRVPRLAEPPRHGHSTEAPRGCSWTSGLGAWLTRNTLLCARSAQAGSSSPWPSLGHSRASLRGRGVGCVQSRRRDAELSLSNEDSPAGCHQQPPAPPNPHWGSCNPSWEVSSLGLVSLVGLEVQKWSSLGSTVWRLQGRAEWH